MLAVVRRMVDTIDPCKFPRKQQLTKIEAKRIIGGRDPKGQAKKQARLDWVCTQLVHTSRKLMPRDRSTQMERQRLYRRHTRQSVRPREIETLTLGFGLDRRRMVTPRSRPP